MMYERTKLIHENVIQTMLTFVINSLHFLDTSRNINGVLSLNFLSRFLLIFTVDWPSLEYGIAK